MSTGRKLFTLNGYCLMVWWVVFSVAGTIAYAQSSDPGSPMPLPANPYTGAIRPKDNASYYYSFTAGPGNLTVSVPVKTNGNLSQLSVEVYDSNNSLLLNLDATSSGSTQENSIVLGSSQRLIMKLTGLRSNDSGSFTLKLKGRIDLRPTVTAPAPGPSVPNPSLQPATKDTTPPKIRIISPSVTRGQSANLAASRVSVTGVAADESGVSEVVVRGVTARLDANGNFSAEVMLRVGDNQISVSATDTYGNRAEETFLINRTADAPVPVSAAPPEPDFLKGRYYALLIAVQDYKGPVYNRLDNPLKDAEKLRDVLTTYYTFDKQDVTFLKNPTRDEIIATIEEFEKKLKPEDNFLIFYAGHGQWDKDRQQGYWIPIDVQEQSRSKWLSNGDVRDSIRGIKARHTLLITDACFGGGILKSRGGAPLPTSIEMLGRLQSRTAMTSGAMTTVPDRSVFIEYLTKRLAENKEAYQTAISIFAALQTAVIDNSPRMDDGSRSTPLYGSIQEAGHEGGDFIFVRRH